MRTFDGRQGINPPLFLLVSFKGDVDSVLFHEATSTGPAIYDMKR